MNEIEFVTSMSGPYYERYGHRLVSGFHEAISFPTLLSVYTERTWESGKHHYFDAFSGVRLSEVDLALIEGLEQYLALAKSKTKQVLGFVPPTDPDERLRNPKWDYTKDAVTFGKKGWAILDALETSKADYVFWMDADVVFRKPIPREFLIDLVKGRGVSYFARRKPHCETGFIAFERRSPIFPLFVSVLASYWRGEAPRVFGLSGWTDCHVLDAALAETEKLYGAPGWKPRNLSTQPENDVIAASSLGEYIEHQKGSKKRAAVRDMKGKLE